MGYNKTETAKGEICDNYHQLTVEALDPLSQNPIAALFAKMLKNDLFGV